MNILIWLMARTENKKKTVLHLIWQWHKTEEAENCAVWLKGSSSEPTEPTEPSANRANVPLPGGRSRVSTRQTIWLPCLESCRPGFHPGEGKFELNMNTSLIMCQDRLSPLFEKRSSAFFEGGRLEEREEMRENFFLFFCEKSKHTSGTSSCAQTILIANFVCRKVTVQSFMTGTQKNPKTQLVKCLFNHGQTISLRENVF